MFQFNFPIYEYLFTFLIKYSKEFAKENEF